MLTLSTLPWTAMRRSVAAIVAFVLPLLCGEAAVAEDELGLYLGGAIGQAQVHIDSQDFATENFSKHHSAFQLMAGFRPLPPFGVEIEYIDFGRPTSYLDGGPASATLKGAGAFGMLYLPMPVIDVYAKVGVARLQSSLSGYNENQTTQTNCAPCGPSLFRLDRNDTRFAGGVGAQFKYGALAMRAEFEYFNVASAHPTLAALGLTWTFF